MLTTSASAIRKLERMGEIKGFSVKRQRLEEQQVREVNLIRFLQMHLKLSLLNKALSVMEAKRRWHVPPTFSVEFVAYYHDRSARIEELKRRLGAEVREHSRLREREAATRPKFDLETRRCEAAREENEATKKAVGEFRSALERLRPGKNCRFFYCR